MTDDRRTSMLPAHERMTVDEALDYVKQEKPAQVLIIASDLEAKDFVIRSSQISRKDALWLAEQARLHALDDSLYE